MLFVPCEVDDSAGEASRLRCSSAVAGMPFFPRLRMGRRKGCLIAIGAGDSVFDFSELEVKLAIISLATLSSFGMGGGKVSISSAYFTSRAKSKKEILERESQYASTGFG